MLDFLIAVTLGAALALAVVSLWGNWRVTP